MCGCKEKRKPKKKPKKKPKTKPKKRRSLVAAGVHICRRKSVMRPRKKKLYIRRRRRAKGWDDDYLANMPVKGGLYPKKTTESKYDFLK